MIAKKKGKEEDKGEEKKESTCEEVVQEADTMVGVEPPKKVETPDRRGNAAMINVMKNKLRAGMGIKNPIVMVDPDEVEDKYEKMATSDEMKTSCEESDLSITDTIKKIVEGNRPFSGAGEYPMRDAMRDAGMNNAPVRPRPNVPVKKAQKKPTTQMAGYEPEGNLVDENLQDVVDKVTRTAQSGLEKMGVKINRTPRGTVTKADQDKKIEKNVK